MGNLKFVLQCKIRMGQLSSIVFIFYIDSLTKISGFIGMINEYICFVSLKNKRFGNQPKLSHLINSYSYDPQYLINSYGWNIPFLCAVMIVTVKPKREQFLKTRMFSNIWRECMGVQLTINFLWNSKIFISVSHLRVLFWRKKKHSNEKF